MRFGHMPPKIMNNKLKIFFTAIVLSTFSCNCGNNNNSQQASITISPDAGTVYKSGDVVKVDVNLPSGTKVDSVVYLLDSVKLFSKKDTSAIILKTDTMKLGAKLITAKIYTDGKYQDVSTNIVLMAGKAPVDYTCKSLPA